MRLSMWRAASAGLVLVAATACSTPQPTPPAYDVLITNAQIVDGSGGAARRGAVAITGGKIAEIGEVNGTATRTIDAKGRTLAPGFIDMHATRTCRS